MIQNMDSLNQFFKKLYSNPSLMWKAGAGVMFLTLSLVIIFSPNLIDGLTNNSRYAFSGLLAVYGVFRLMTFYGEYKRLEDE